MIRMWPVLLAWAVWLPLVAGETAPVPEALWVNQFDDPAVLERETRLEGTRFLVPKTKFYIADEPTASDGKVLVVEAPKATGVLMSAPKVDLKKRPILRWRWRVVRSVGLRPDAKEPDDQAVVLYFGDGTLLKQRCVGYRWERNTELGKSGLLSYVGGMMTVKFFCVRNRETPEGEWVVEERDVIQDYIDAFGKEPNEYFILSVGANSQYSGSQTRAEIDFVEFVPRSEPQEKEE